MFYFIYQSSSTSWILKILTVVGNGISLFVAFYLFNSVAKTEKLFFSFLIIYFIYLVSFKRILIKLVKSRGFGKLLNNLDVIVIVVFFTKYFTTGIPANQDLIIALLTVIAFFAFSTKSLLSQLFFENKPIVYFGKISYPFYLTHFIIIRLIGPLIKLPPYQIIILLFVTIVTISSLLHFYIEKPFIALGKRLSTKL